MAHLSECTCGSGKRPMPQFDARAIFLCYTCDECHDTKMESYRPEVLDDPNYECCEAIEED